jgi:hypothetical protein
MAVTKDLEKIERCGCVFKLATLILYALTQRSIVKISKSIFYNFNNQNATAKKSARNFLENCQEKANYVRKTYQKFGVACFFFQ